MLKNQLGIKAALFTGFAVCAMMIGCTKISEPVEAPSSVAPAVGSENSSAVPGEPQSNLERKNETLGFRSGRAVAPRVGI